jgi:hypothetical protein
MIALKTYFSTVSVCSSSVLAVVSTKATACTERAKQVKIGDNNKVFHGTSD